MYMYVHACHPALTIVVSLPDTVALKNYGKVWSEFSSPFSSSQSFWGILHLSSQCIRSGYLRLLSLCQDVIAMCGSHHTAGENITTWQTGAPLCSLGCQQSVSLHSAFSQSSQVLTNPVSFTQLLLCPLSPWPMGHFHLQSTHYLDP